MSGPLSGLTIVEVSAFVAAPFAGMNLAQLGAEVIRIDPIAGNVDLRRWPLSPSGSSIYWASLNKAKKSAEIDLKSRAGQAIAADLVRTAGIVITNLPTRGWLDFEHLREARDDLIMVELVGNYDGSPAVDYSVNPASGFAIATGPNEEPVNHVLPAWDTSAGLYMALAVLAADRSRSATGRGQKVRVALSDVMLATVAGLGYVADVQLNGHVRAPDGNYIYGAFGRDFPTSDGRQVMIAAMTPRHWRAIVAACEADEALAELGRTLGRDFGLEENRYEAREAIAEVLEPWFACRDLREIEEALTREGALYGVYRDFGQLVAEDPRCSERNPLFSTINQPGLGSILIPQSPLTFGAFEGRFPPAPTLGQHTEEVLKAHLSLTDGELAALQHSGVINKSSRHDEG